MVRMLRSELWDLKNSIFNMFLFENTKKKNITRLLVNPFKIHKKKSPMITLENQNPIKSKTTFLVMIYFSQHVQEKRYLY